MLGWELVLPRHVSLPSSVGGGALGALCLRSYWEPVPSVIHSEEESPRI